MVDVNYYIEIAGGIVIHLQAGIVHLNYGSVPFPFATFCVCGWTPPPSHLARGRCVLSVTKLTYAKQILNKSDDPRI